MAFKPQIVDLRRKAPKGPTVPKAPRKRTSSSTSAPKAAHRPARAKLPAAPRNEPLPRPKPSTEPSASFAALGLSPSLLRAVAAAGYESPTPIQAQAIPPAAAGRDVLGIAQTGTGKTAAFTLPLLHRLASAPGRPHSGRPRALVLTPTRELAIQIGESLTTYGRHLKLRHAVIFGGVGQNPQVKALRRGLDILVATPGRLLDLRQQGHVAFDKCTAFVLDEADRMLDMGFIHDVKRVLAELPKKRQTLLFSATMPDTIVKLANRMLTDYTRVEVTPPATTVERIRQELMFVAKTDKKRLLADLFADRSVTRALVFMRTKHHANRLTAYLDELGITAAAIHGNKSQKARQRALAAFQEGRIRALVATDIAARGIDVPGVSHVINVDLPNEPESYVHRIGRTARAGAEGIAISFCMRDELDYLRDIERLTGQSIPVIDGQPYHAEHIAVAYANGERGSVPQGGRGRGQRSGGGRGGGRGGRGGRARQNGQRRGGRPPGRRQSR